MITLADTTQILEMTTSAAVAIDAQVTYVDHTSSGGALGEQTTDSTTATTTTILSAPAASTKRQIKMINILNTSVTTACTVTVRKDISAVDHDYITVVLGPLERLEYLDGQGFRCFTTTGAVKTSINQGNAPSTTGQSAVVLPSDQTNNNAVANTIQDVTGLSFPVLAGKKYHFKFVIFYTAAATTTGSRWTINGPAFTMLNYISEYSLTTSTSTRNGQQTAYDMPAASNGTSALTTSNFATIEGIIMPSADGTVIARFASEVAASAIVAKAGSTVFYQQLD